MSTVIAAPLPISTGARPSRTGLYGLLPIPALLLLAFIYCYPIAYLVKISFTDPEFGLQNYISVLTSPSVARVALRTLRISLETTLLTVLLAYPVAYVLTYGGVRHRKALMLFVLLPLWTSGLIRSFAWIALLGGNGLVNQVLRSINPDLSVSLLWSETGVLIGMVNYMLPMAVLPLWAGMRNIDTRCLAASRSMGATAFQTFGRVYLPMSASAIGASASLVFIYSVGFFVTPAMLGGGKVLMVTEYIKGLVGDTLDWGRGSALAVLLTVFVLGAIALTSRFLKFGKAQRTR